MLSRRNSIYRRLMTAYALLIGCLLLVVGLTGLVYYFGSVRDDRRESTHAVASILATQSAAALMFGDAQALRENLASLKDMAGLRWAAIVPGRIALPLDAVRHGDAPADLGRVLADLADRQESMSLFKLTVRAPILHRDEVRGQLLISIDLHAEVFEFEQVAAFTLLLLLAAFLLGRGLFRRIVLSVVAPLHDLIAATSSVALKARAEEALDGVKRPVADFADEIGKLADAFNLMVDSIVRRDAERQDQSIRLAQTVEDLRALSARMRAVREEERTRISHEIHDELGQRLTALKYEIARLDNSAAGALVGEGIDELIRAVRVISWELRPSVLDSLGLVAAIDWQAQDFSRRSGVRCLTDLPEETVDVAPEIATDLFRACQELLTNVMRHAQASRVDIILEATDEALHLEVKDNGRGLRAQDHTGPSLGLLGIRERLERWGGSVKFDPAQAQGAQPGTHVRIMIPRRLAGASSYLELNHEDPAGR